MAPKIEEDTIKYFVAQLHLSIGRLGTQAVTLRSTEEQPKTQNTVYRYMESAF